MPPKHHDAMNYFMEMLAELDGQVIKIWPFALAAAQHIQEANDLIAEFTKDGLLIEAFIAGLVTFPGDKRYYVRYKDYLKENGAEEESNGNEIKS